MLTNFKLALAILRVYSLFFMIYRYKKRLLFYIFCSKIKSNKNTSEEIMSFFALSLLIIYGLIIVLNLAFSLSWATLLYMFISLVIVLLPAAIFLFVGRILPRKWFSNDKLIFRENKFKNYICKITNVKVWKDKIPVGGHVAGFRMNKLDNPKDLEKK